MQAAGFWVAVGVQRMPGPPQEHLMVPGVGVRGWSRGQDRAGMGQSGPLEGEKVGGYGRNAKKRHEICSRKKAKWMAGQPNWMPFCGVTEIPIIKRSSFFPNAQRMGLVLIKINCGNQTLKLRQLRSPVLSDGLGPISSNKHQARHMTQNT